jgi:WD40 repeat protein
MHLIKTNPFYFLLLFAFLLAFPKINAQQNLPSGEVILNIGHQRPIEKLQFANQDNYFLSQDEYGILKIWDVASGKELYTINDSTITLNTQLLPTAQAQSMSYIYNGQQHQLNLLTGKIAIEPNESEKDNPVALDDSRRAVKETNPSYPLYSVELLKDGKVEVWSTDGKQLLWAREFPTERIRIYSFNQKEIYSWCPMAKKFGCGTGHKIGCVITVLVFYLM